MKINYSTRNSITKKLLCWLTVIALVFSASYAMLLNVGLKYDFESYAASIGSSSVEIDDLSNPDFEDGTGEPDGYTGSQDTATFNGTAEVVDLSDSSGDYYSAYNTNETNALVLESGSDATYFKYETDDTITLSSDGHYEIKVSVYTSNNNGIANLFLYDSDGEVYAKLTDLSSSGAWNAFYFFISTNDIEDVELTLGLVLSGDGYVMFDDIEVYQINENLLNTYINTLSSSSYTYVNEVDNLVNYISVDSKTFTSNGDIYNNIITDNEAFDGTTTDYSALKVYNLSDNGSYGTLYTSDDFNDTYLTLNQNRVYKISVMLKVADISGTISLQLVETGLTDDDGNEISGTDSDELSITSDTSSDVNNGYRKYSFFVNTYPLKSASFKLVISYGSSDNLTTGTLYISSITITKSTSSAMSDASETYNETVDLTTDYVLSYDADDTAFILDNGNFNGMEITDYNNPYPATATSWDITEGTSGNQQYGVINTKTDEFSLIDSTLFSNLSNPNGDNDTEGNNMLMLYNGQADTLSATSQAISLDADSYHFFSLQVQTQNSPVIISLVTTDDDDNEIVLTSISVDTSSAWKTVYLYLHTGYQDIDVSLKITLTTTGYGYAYIDNTYIDYYLAPTEDQFNAVENGNYTIKADLSSMISTSSGAQWGDADFFTGEGTAATAGVIDVNSSLDSVLSDSEYANSFKSIDGDGYVLGIRNMANNTYYSYTSKFGYTMSSGSYYKITVSVYTQLLSKLDEDADLSLYGASISLSDFDESFTGIVSDNKWTTFTFYICPDSDVTTYITLALASESAGITSDAFFGNITFSEIEETDFEAAKATSTTLVLSTTSVDEEEEEEDEDSDSSGAEIATILYYISTIIFAVAIIIAIVGVLIRRIHWRKPRKKSKNEYDRNKTVSKQLYERKATTIREGKIHEIEKEIKELAASRAVYEEEYKANLSKVRELKVKRADKAEIAKAERELKKNQKMSSNIGMSISRLESDLEYIKSDAYMLSLMRKFATENEIALKQANNQAKEEEQAKKKQSTSKEKTETTSDEDKADSEDKD